jgi:hypothetical protein
MSATATGGSRPWLMPSAWGFVTWTAWLMLYLCRLIRWDPVTPAALLVFAGVTMAWPLSMLLMRPLYAALPTEPEGAAPGGGAVRGGTLGIVFLHLVGLVGMVLYVRDLAARLGGWGGFLAALAFGSNYIRWALEDSISIGTQLSYFGWVAVGLSIVASRRGYGSRPLTILAVVQVLANFLFVDRTRPTWIGFICLAVLVATAPHLRWRRLLGGGAAAIVVFLIVFTAVANWLGKVPEEGAYGASPLPLPLQSMYQYGTAGFAYFNEILGRLAPGDYDSVRVLNPMWKLLARLGFAAEPPSQVNEMGCCSSAAAGRWPSWHGPTPASSPSSPSSRPS